MCPCDSQITSEMPFSPSWNMTSFALTTATTASLYLSLSFVRAAMSAEMTSDQMCLLLKFKGRNQSSADVLHFGAAGGKWAPSSRFEHRWRLAPQPGAAGYDSRVCDGNRPQERSCIGVKRRLH